MQKDYILSILKDKLLNKNVPFDKGSKSPPFHGGVMGSNPIWNTATSRTFDRVKVSLPLKLS